MKGIVMRTDLQAIVLAAGKSSRMHTGKSKLLEKICGQELISYTTHLLSCLHIPTIFVVGHKKEKIIPVIQHHYPLAQFVEQPQQKGTGDAFIQSAQAWKADTLLVINGDLPLLTDQLLKDLEEKHYSSQATVTFVTSFCDPSNTSYGRVFEENNAISVIEAAELSAEALRNNCRINAGIYLLSRPFAQQTISNLTPNRMSNELYITDLIHIAQKQGLVVSTVSTNFDTIRGVNTLEELWAVEQIKRASLIRHWMNNGVRFIAPQTNAIDISVTIGQGTVISAGVHLLGKTTIGKDCSIQPFSIIEHCIIEDDVIVHAHSVVTDAILHSQVSVGPFAFVRSKTVLKRKSSIGAFVDIKNSTLGELSKAKHLSYLGDATIGREVNIGAGSITCNYDGIKKHKTIIDDYVFVGSNNTLVAPLQLGKGSFTAAGSVITESIPTDALAFGRARQVTKPEYAKKLRAKKGITSNTDEKNDSSFVAAKKIDKEEFNR